MYRYRREGSAVARDVGSPRWLAIDRQPRCMASHVVTDDEVSVCQFESLLDATDLFFVALISVIQLQYCPSTSSSHRYILFMFGSFCSESLAVDIEVADCVNMQIAIICPHHHRVLISTRTRPQ